jgi:hypothetical protein
MESNAPKKKPPNKKRGVVIGGLEEGKPNAGYHHSPDL